MELLRTDRGKELRMADFTTVLAFNTCGVDFGLLGWRS